MSTGIGKESDHVRASSADPRPEIVASVVGVAGAGFRLSLILNAISCDLVNAPADIKAISKSVTLYSHLLKQTAATLENVDSVHSAQALETTQQVLEESNAVFNEISAMLNKVQSTKPDGSISPSMAQRIRWCFKRHAVEYLLGRMDRLQMSLSLMLQIMQLGTTLASTSRHDPPEKVQEMTGKIKRERMEAQTVVIQYWLESQKLDALSMAAREEATEPVSPLEYKKEDNESDALTLVSSQDSQIVKVEQNTISAGTAQMISQHKPILNDLGDNWTRLGESKADMVNRSEAIINQLVDQWTVWRQRRDQPGRQPRLTSKSSYKSHVQDSHDDDDSPFFERYSDREDSPAGKYLEGPTVDWRNPNSGEARREARKLRKAYQPYQPSVEASSELDDSPGSNGSSKRASHKHVLNSDPESSDSETDNQRSALAKARRRRSSAVAVPSQQKRTYYDEPASTSQSLNIPQELPATSTPRPPANTSAHRPSTVSSMSSYGQHQQRPFVTPDQSTQHHSYTSPAPHMYNPNNMYYPQSPVSTLSPNSFYAPVPHQQHYSHAPSNPSYPPPPNATSAQNRYVPRLQSQTSRGPIQTQQRPQSKDGPQRPQSRDGKPPRSPSRLSREYTAADYRAYEEERKRHKKEAKRNLTDGAAKGLLAGGGLAVFLEALDSLSL